MVVFPNLFLWFLLSFFLLEILLQSVLLYFDIRARSWKPKYDLQLDFIPQSKRDSKIAIESPLKVWDWWELQCHHTSEVHIDNMLSDMSLPALHPVLSHLTASSVLKCNFIMCVIQQHIVHNQFIRQLNGTDLFAN